MQGLKSSLYCFPIFRLGMDRTSLYLTFQSKIKSLMSFSQSLHCPVPGFMKLLKKVFLGKLSPRNYLMGASCSPRFYEHFDRNHIK